MDLIDSIKDENLATAEFLCVKEQMNMTDIDGRTPLMVSIIKRFDFLSDKLLGLGCDIHVKDRFGENALMHCCRHGTPNILVKLKFLGAVPDESCLLTSIVNSRLDLAGLLINWGVDINCLTANGNSLLCLACHKKDYQCIDFLLERGIDVTLGNGKALMISVIKEDSSTIKKIGCLINDTEIIRECCNFAKGVNKEFLKNRYEMIMLMRQAKGMDIPYIKYRK